MKREREPKLATPLASKIRVLFLPTSTFYVCGRGCNLSKVCLILNQLQETFHFEIVEGVVSPQSAAKHTSHEVSGIRLRRKSHRQFMEFASGAPDQALKREVVRTYYQTVDVFEQIEEFYWHVRRRELRKTEFAVAIGSEVVLPDIEENEFFGIADQDAYSLVGDDFGETADNYRDGETYDNNDDHRRYGNIAFISLLRCNLLFPEQRFDSARYGRATVARYIILNIGNMFAAEMFASPLPREHTMRCIADTSWSGVETERLGYSKAVLCDECLEKANDYGVADKFAPRAASETIGVIQRICSEADYIARKSQKSYEKLVEYSLILGGIGLTTNLVASYDNNQSISDYVGHHVFAAAAAFGFIVLGICIEIWALLTDRRLP